VQSRQAIGRLGAWEHMDTEQFVASLVSSLAWPAAVVCIAVVFRSQLKTLLTDRLRHIEAGPIKADFDRVGSKVEATLGEAGIPVPAHAESPDLANLAAQVPEMVIAEAFGLVEQELRRALEAVDEEPPDDARADQLTQLAAARGLISPLTVNAIEGVTVMRNLAIHGPQREITTKQVDEYLALIEGVIYAIHQNIKRHEAKPAEQKGN
jgi:hypothetical protein